MGELGCFAGGEEGTDAFVKYFSGDVDGAFDANDDGSVDPRNVQTWATPYALSIVGKRYTNNCPYGTGEGYGDGRAISVGEVLVAVDGRGGGSAATQISVQKHQNVITKKTFLDSFAKKGLYL